MKANSSSARHSHAAHQAAKLLHRIETAETLMIAEVNSETNTFDESLTCG